VEEFLFLIRNSNIVITGTSRGVGYELAKKFLSNGNKVWGCSRRKSNIHKKNYFHTKMNLCNENKIKKWVKKIEKQTNKKIDILISNSSIFNRSLNSLEAESSITETIKTNLLAPMMITKHISKCMIQNKKGTIIFFSSIASILEEIGTSSYASSKSALESFSKIIKNELKIFNINVSVFRILYVSTELSNKLNKKKIINLKKKFKTNKFGTINKIYKNIVKIFEDKKNTPNTVLFDTLKKSNK
jgi:short-subunit dehydrogenase